MQQLVRFLVLGTIILTNSFNVNSQNNRIDLDNNSYDTAYFRQVLPADAIKAIKFPAFKSLEEALSDTVLDYLKDNDWVLVFKHNNIVKLYPIMPLIWHEVVNDQIDDLKIAVTYCVLTGSPMVYNRTLESGEVKTLGVSGCLYNSNLVMYDYQTRSTWPQLLSTCKSGIDKDKNLSLLSFEWAKFSYVKKHYPNAQILIGDNRMMNFINMYKRFPFEGLEQYPNHDSLKFPAGIPEDLTHSLKEEYLYFPDKQKAVITKHISKSQEDMIDVVYEGDEIKCLRPVGENVFIPLYNFALKVFYPEVEVFE